MIIFYIKMKIRAGGGNFRAAGGALGQQGAPPPLLFRFMRNTNLGIDSSSIIQIGTRIYS